MANTREIKNRIESVQQTRKITNAMYLIASTKLRKARNDLTNTRPYFDADRKSTRLNSSHREKSRMPSSA